MRLGRKIRVLDLGCGSGQLARALLGLSDVEVHLCDSDESSAEFCANHPELCDLPFHLSNILDPDDAMHLQELDFDVVVALGVLHHVPPQQRVDFVRTCGEISGTVIFADEGILEYRCEYERVAYAKNWYDFVIGEAQRRGLKKLAALERRFMKSDISPLRTLTDDFKVSLSEVLKVFSESKMDVKATKVIGDWDKFKGGMYLIEAERGIFL